MGEGPGHHCLVCLERDGCSSHHHNRFQRSHFLPSFCSLFHATKEERTVSVPGRERVPHGGAACSKQLLCLRLCLCPGSRCPEQKRSAARWG